TRSACSRSSWPVSSPSSTTILIGVIELDDIPHMPDNCTWCGVRVEDDDGFRPYEPAGGRRGGFCRRGHVVPSALRGPRGGALRLRRRSVSARRADQPAG